MTGLACWFPRVSTKPRAIATTTTRERPLPKMEGREGAMFTIYWGEVSTDSDGPVEMCKPVPESDAQALASQYPELSLRTEPAHREAYVAIPNDALTAGPGGNPGVQWQLASETLRAWWEEHGIKPEELAVKPEDLGVRITYVASEPVTETSPPTATSPCRSPEGRGRLGLRCPQGAGRWQSHIHNTRTELRSVSVRLSRQHDGTGGVVDQRRLGAPVCGPTLRRCGEPALRDALDGSLMGRRPCRGWTLRRLPVACRHGSSRSTGRMSPRVGSESPST
jgi:hypothetical protein